VTDAVAAPGLPVSTAAWRTFWGVSAAAHVVLFFLRFSYLWLDDVVHDESGTMGKRAIEEFTGALGAFLCSGLIFAAWRRWPLRPRPQTARALGYLVLGTAISALHTTFMWGTRTLAFPMLGRGEYNYGRMPLRYAMELPGELIGFAMVVMALWLSDSVTDQRRQAVREVTLERALVESRLRTLQLQLQPHFLFNALNTIASTLHVDAMLADRLIGRLADLLRASYRADETALVPFRDELALLHAYAELMHARFGERLTLTIDRGTVSDDTLVPPLLLQPLVENAVRHGRLERDGVAEIAVEAHTSEDYVTVRVFDDGTGMPEATVPFGTGLSSGAQRLALLFGARGTLTTHQVPGGFEVRVRFPRRRA
jgi:two-component sensor histidine kinase